MNKFLIFFLCIFFLSFLSAFSIEEKENVCDALNYSSFACWEFWVQYDSNETCELVNNTIYIPVENNCTEEFEYKSLEFTHELEMAKVDKGVVQVEINKDTCKNFIDDAVIEVTSKTQAPPQEKKEESSWYFAGALVLIIVVYLFFKFKDKINPKNISVVPTSIKIKEVKDGTKKSEGHASDSEPERDF